MRGLRLIQGLGPSGGRRSKSANLLSAYGQGVAFDFTDNSLAIDDLITPANNYLGSILNPDGSVNKFTFTRASSATRVNTSGLIELAAADKLRSDNSRGYPAALIEGASTNMLLNSKFEGGGAIPTSWSKTGGTGTTTPVASTKFPGEVAYEMDATAQRPFFQQTVTTVAATTYVMSMYIEAVSAGVTLQQILWNIGETPAAWYVDGVAAAFSTIATAGTRVSLVWTATLTSITPRFGLGTVANITATCRISCPQIEVRAFPTSYIPTAGATATRAADLLILPSTLFNLTQAQGTLYVDNNFDGGTGIGANNRVGIAVNDGTGNERHILYNATQRGAFGVDGGAAQYNTADAGATLADGVAGKNALSFALNDISFVASNRAPVTDVVATMPTTTRLEVGSSVGFSLYGGVRAGAFFAAKLSDAQKGALTT